MNKDKTILAAAILVLGIVAAFFGLQTSAVSHDAIIDDAQNRSPFAAAKEEQSLARRNESPKKLQSGETANQTSIATPKASELVVTSLDVFGVRHGELIVEVENPEGEKLRDVSVRLHAFTQSPISGQQRGQLLQEKLTDAKGMVHLKAIESGLLYSVLVQSKGAAKFKLEPFQVLPGERRTQRVVMGGGLSFGGIVVSKNTGNPVPNAIVRVYDINEQTIVAEDSVESEVFTDDKGRFEVIKITQFLKLTFLCIHFFH